jgi:hypothetical protein
VGIVEKLLEAAGISETANLELSLAALPCADRAKAPGPLSPPENAALSEFMAALEVK